MITHVPVLVREVMEFLRPDRGGVYIDATLGLGGHGIEILKAVAGRGLLIGLDRDEESLKVAEARFKAEGLRDYVLRKARFSEMENVLKELHIDGAEGVLLDLGLSMYQLKAPGRGMSFMVDEPLDMRMDRAAPLTAREIVNEYREEELARIFWEYGEERNSRKIARAIVTRRSKKPIETTGELAELVTRFYRGHWRVHPATRVFQALRIAVNNELWELGEALNSLARLLHTGGRLAAISYHSLEDRAVKHFIREKDKEGVFKSLTKKPVTPSVEEIRANPSARSAKLRAAEKLA
jgi:16S rRNA (cytosine1402-N4)-methyltransferase